MVATTFAENEAFSFKSIEIDVGVMTLTERVAALEPTPLNAIETPAGNNLV